MSYTVKYTQAQYNAKLTELEGYHSQLASHLQTMESLKSSMYQFWNDDNARKTGEALAAEIRQVKNAMTRTSDLITFYKSSVERMNAANSSAGSVVGEALDVLKKIGI